MIAYKIAAATKQVKPAMQQVGSNILGPSAKPGAAHC